MSSLRAVYCPHHSESKPKQAQDARARTWRFVLDCWEQKIAAGEVGGEEHARKEFRDISRNHTISQP